MLVPCSEVQNTKRSRVQISVVSSFYVEHMAVCIIYNQYNLQMYDLCLFIRYLVSITQVLKDT
jgi:hypothetical protein